MCLMTFKAHSDTEPFLGLIVNKLIKRVIILLHIIMPSCDILVLLMRTDSYLCRYAEVPEQAVEEHQRY